jgi:hypothetical protein
MPPAQVGSRSATEAKAAGAAAGDGARLLMVSFKSAELHSKVQGHAILKIDYTRISAGQLLILYLLATQDLHWPAAAVRPLWDGR